MKQAHLDAELLREALLACWCELVERSVKAHGLDYADKELDKIWDEEVEPALLAWDSQPAQEPERTISIPVHPNSSGGYWRVDHVPGCTYLNGKTATCQCPSQYKAKGWSA